MFQPTSLDRFGWHLKGCAPPPSFRQLDCLPDGGFQVQGATRPPPTSSAAAATALQVCSLTPLIGERPVAIGLRIRQPNSLQPIFC